MTHNDCATKIWRGFLSSGLTAFSMLILLDIPDGGIPTPQVHSIARMTNPQPQPTPTTQAIPSIDFADYLRIKFPETNGIVAKGDWGPHRLSKLWNHASPNAPNTRLHQAFQSITDPFVRLELVELTAQTFHEVTTAQLMVTAFSDPEPRVRAEAVRGIRAYLPMQLTARNKQERRDPDPATFLGDPPLMNHLINSVIKAALDPSERVRFTSHRALVECNHPKARHALQRALKDPSPRLQLHAACMLGLLKDDAGLPWLLTAAIQLDAQSDQLLERGLFWETENVMRALTNLTYRSFGPIPLDPGLHPTEEARNEAEKRFRNTLRTCAAWARSSNLRSTHHQSNTSP